MIQPHLLLHRLLAALVHARDLFLIEPLDDVVGSQAPEEDKRAGEGGQEERRQQDDQREPEAEHREQHRAQHAHDDARQQREDEHRDAHDDEQRQRDAGQGDLREQERGQLRALGREFHELVLQFLALRWGEPFVEDVLARVEEVVHAAL